MVTKQFETKVFKSGNSLAIRVPKAIGIEEAELVNIYKNEFGELIITPKKSKLNKLFHFIDNHQNEFKDFMCDRNDYPPEEREIF